MGNLFQLSANITLITKPDKDVARKESHRPMSLLSIVAKFHNKILTYQTQQYKYICIYTQICVCICVYSIYIYIYVYICLYLCIQHLHKYIFLHLYIMIKWGLSKECKVKHLKINPYKSPFQVTGKKRPSDCHIRCQK